MLTDGVITDEHGLGIFRPGLLEEEFLSSRFGDEAEEDIFNGEYHSFDLESLNVEGTLFGARIFFKGGKLWMLNLRKVTRQVSWSDWSEAQELQVKQEHDRFLSENLGEGERSFKWGKIESVFDGKSGVSWIVLRYLK
tara:strand:- start:325 stop:738 length:414 start_codon:yes stop_codon:yes gene_type:complete